MKVIYFSALAMLVGLSHAVNHKRLIRQASNLNPNGYRNPYLDIIPGAYEGTYKEVPGKIDVNGKPIEDAPETVYTKKTEGTISSDSPYGPGITDFKTKINYIPGKESSSKNNYGNNISNVPYSIAKSSANKNTVFVVELLGFCIGLIAGATHGLM